MPSPFQPQTLYDYLDSLDGGVNSGSSPLKLRKDVMADAVNVTVRGEYATHRSAYHRRIVTYANTTIQTVVESGYFQGACDYLSDAGNSSKLALISGRLFQFAISGNSVTCAEVRIVSNGSTDLVGGPQASVEIQAWLWQSEYFVIIQDGKNPALFYDGHSNTAYRSNWKQPVNYATTVTADFTGGAGIPAIGSSQIIPFASIANLVTGNIVTLRNYGTFQVLVIAGLNVTLLNLTATPAGATGLTGTAVSWVNQGTQLPPGRMGCYGLGRNWQSLIDGKQFMAGDIVNGSSGTAANNFRDAVIYSTENLFIVGGGNFTVPGSVGAIRAMRFVATLDASLGQGPLQVFTSDRVFSCNAPVDRLTWQSVSNPILTESLIANGGLGQNSTVLANGDAMFRSVDGIRSLILARREFNTWGNVPISFEVSPLLENDDPGLLQFGSAIVFDNRMLMTVGTTQDTGGQGVYFQGLLAINFDTISSLSEKKPSVWDGLWTGLNVMQLTVGEVTGVQRAFAFVLNTGSTTRRIEFWEILNTFDDIADNDGTNALPITWQLDSSSLRFGVGENDRKYMKLTNGEMQVNDLQGSCSFTTFFKPDQYPCWQPWASWTSCQGADASDSQPGFRPRMGMGTPPGNVCDLSTNRPMTEGFTFQTRTRITGHCVIVGAWFEAQTKPMPAFARFECGPIC